MDKDLAVQLLGALVRNGVTAFGVYLGTWGLTVSGSMQDQLVGAIMVLVALGWSGGQKWWAERRKRTAEVAAAKASAQLGQPVTVNVTPEGQPNEAIRIPAVELAKAPPAPAIVKSAA